MVLKRAVKEPEIEKDLPSTKIEDNDSNEVVEEEIVPIVEVTNDTPSVHIVPEPQPYRLVEVKKRSFVQILRSFFKNLF